MTIDRDKRIERIRKIGFMMCNINSPSPASISTLQNPLFFVGSDDLSGRLGDHRPVICLPIWPILREVEDIDMISTGYIQDIYSVQPVGPYLLGGYCFGGMVAFEMARRLIADGHRVDLLVLVEALSPGDYEDRLRLIRRLLLAALYPSELMRFLFARTKRAFIRNRGDSSAGNNDQFRISYIRSGTNAWKAYTALPYPGRITLCIGNRSIHRFFPVAGWNKLALGCIDVNIIPGNHQTVLHSNELAAVIANRIDRLMCIPDMNHA